MEEIKSKKEELVELREAIEDIKRPFEMESWRRRSLHALEIIFEENPDKIDGLTYEEDTSRVVGWAPEEMKSIIRKTHDGGYTIDHIEDGRAIVYPDDNIPKETERGKSVFHQLASKVFDTINSKEYRKSFVRDLEKRTGVNLDEESLNVEREIEELTLSEGYFAIVEMVRFVDKEGNTSEYDAKVRRYFRLEKRLFRKPKLVLQNILCASWEPPKEKEIRNILTEKEGIAPKDIFYWY